MEGPGFDGMLAKAQAQWAIEREVLLKRLEDLKKGPGTKHSTYDRHIGSKLLVSVTTTISPSLALLSLSFHFNRLHALG